MRMSLLLFLLTIASPAAAVEGDRLDSEVKEVFRRRCVACHDDRPGDAGGDVDNLLDLHFLSNPDNGYLGQGVDDSYLAELILEGAMPLPIWKSDIKGNGPLTAEEKATLLRWIERGGESEAHRRIAEREIAGAQRTVIDDATVVERIVADLQSLPGEERRFARYFSFTNLHNHSQVSQDQLEQFRHGLVKLLNSLSRSPRVLGLPNSAARDRIHSIDPAATIYRFDLRHLGWEVADWDRVAQYYPYALVRKTAAWETVGHLTDSPQPFLRADWFAFVASQAPLYHDLLKIEDTLLAVETRLGVNRLENIGRFQAARAGFANSQVSVNNRLLERHEGLSGYYHISYDFARNNGKANLFDFPLGPSGALEDTFAFEHDGGEVIYRLPNGFQAYLLVDSKGNRLNVAPTAIVHDDSMSAQGGAILNGVSCISCHYDGMKPENPARLRALDEVGVRAQRNFRRFGERERALIAKLYPTGERFAALLEEDRTSWRAAQQQAGLTQRWPIEPVRALFDNFARNLDLETAAAEFGLSPEEFTQRMQGESETRQIAARLANRGVQRQLFQEEFQTIARLTGMGEPRSFERLALPYFGEDPSVVEEAAPEITQNLLTENTAPRDLTVSVGNPDDRYRFVEGEAIPCRIKANRNCFVTVLAIDAEGEVTSLLPNRFHSQHNGDRWWSSLQLQANQSLEITLEKVGFEFFAQPPHGVTKVRVIVTRDRPLTLQYNRALADQIRAKSFPALGVAKGIGVRAGAAKAEDQPLLDQSILASFGPNEWAVAEWTFVTVPKSP